jgi:hypothetical protein
MGRKKVYGILKHEKDFKQIFIQESDKPEF